MGIEEFEDIKGVIRSRKLKDRQYNDQNTKRQTMIQNHYTEGYNGQYESSHKRIPAPLVAPIVLHLLQTR